ncbi:MAG: hypothetical protein MJZ76_10950 [Bacteroidales bacterium]|nr:hypothetical protein [Bacteroidales bacterium]
MEDFWTRLKELFFPSKNDIANKQALEKRPTIECDIEQTTIKLQDVVDYVNNRMLGLLKIDEVVVIDANANAELLKMVQKYFQLKVNGKMSVLYIMDVINKGVTKITCICADGLDDDLVKELNDHNHIIRFR